MTTKPFHLGTLLTITDGRLLTDIGNVYEILGWMTGESLFTHQLPRAMAECKPHLLRQHPFLKSDTMQYHRDQLTKVLAATDDPKAAIEAWLNVVAHDFGSLHEVEPVPDAHEPRDPLQELAEMMPDKPIIALTPPEDNE